MKIVFEDKAVIEVKSFMGVKICHFFLTVEIPESDGRVDWSSTFAGIELPNEAYARSSTILKMPSKQRNYGDKGSMTHKPRQQQRESMRALS